MDQQEINGHLTLHENTQQLFNHFEKSQPFFLFHIFDMPK